MNGLNFSNASSAASNAALYAANPAFGVLPVDFYKPLLGSNSFAKAHSYHIFGIIFALAFGYRPDANFAVYPSA
jgi:hypothetical protein